MRFKAIALALFIAGAGASYAVAGDGHGKGKGGDTTSTSASAGTTTTARPGKGHGSTCRPNVAFVLNGTFVAAASDGSFTMTVTHANHHAKALGNPATVLTDASTRIVRNGKRAALADLLAGDRLNVLARGCKSPPAGTTQALLARRVVAHPAQSGTTTTTTSAETTSETTTTTAP